MKNVSPNPAAKAVKDLFLTGNGKRRRFLGMEWTEGFIVTAAALKRQILGDHFDDIATPTHLFNDFLGDVINHDRSLEV
jgi:hypothetical protein